MCPGFAVFAVFANQLDLNPAFAGSQQYHRIIMNYRNQWPEMGNPYVTYSFSFDTHLYKWNSGVGVRIEQDRQGAGALKTLTVSGMYSYLVKIRPEDAGLRFAVGASMIQNSLDMSKLEFPDMIDPIYGSIYPHNPADDPQKYKKVTCDFSAGVLGFSDLIILALRYSISESLLWLLEVMPIYR